MFTGIIEHVGRLESIELDANGGRMRVHAGPLAADLAVAGSIAVNGCCLTVVEITGQIFAADLSAETLRLTGFSGMAPGKSLNLERPLTAGKELGGHFVQGHVDGVGHITQLSPEGENWRLSVRIPAGLERYVAIKGSIAIDGISLTVAGINGDVVEAAIIPFTYTNTNLKALAAGDAMNIEVDMLAKHIERYVERLMETRRAPAASHLTVAQLVKEGF